MDVPRVTAHEVRRWVDEDEDVTFVDSRKPVAGGQATDRLPLAIRVPADELSMHLGEIPSHGRIVVYCT